MSLYLRAQLRVFVLPPMTPISQHKGSVIRRIVFSTKVISCKVFTYTRNYGPPAPRGLDILK